MAKEALIVTFATAGIRNTTPLDVASGPRQREGDGLNSSEVVVDGVWMGEHCRGQALAAAHSLL